MRGPIPSIPLALGLGLLLACDAGAAREIHLWQTNSAGDDIHIFDVPNRRLVHRLQVGPQPHGIAASRDGRVIFVSLEASGQKAGELLWIDPVTLTIQARLPVGLEPHAIAATPDGRWVYVPCRDGNYWVIDTQSRRVAKRIRTAGRPHNTQISADGRFAYLSPMGEPKRVTIVDVPAGHQVVGEIPFGASVRPPALSPDGRWLFQQIDGLNGFQVADTERRQVVATVRHRNDLGWFQPVKSLGWLSFAGLRRCHGLAVRPDQEEIWSTCGNWLNVHSLSVAGYPQTDAVRLPAPAYWLTFSPDGTQAFVALSDAGVVAIVDAASKEVSALLAAGRKPKRNLALGLPQPEPPRAAASSR